MSPALTNLKHIIVLMMENRSFDHVLGALRQQDQRIDGLTGNEWNPDTTGAEIKVAPQAEFQSQLDPDPGHHYPDVDIQLFSNSPDHVSPTMQGFIEAYFQQRKDVNHSHKVMNYFTPDKLPVVTTLARKYAVFNRWFSSLPGPTIPNRAFAHFGTSFGHTDMNVFYVREKYLSVYERMQNAGRTAKIYYYDQQSSTIGVVFLLKTQPQLFGTYDQFLSDCGAGTLPDYCFIEPNYTDHDTDDGEALASDEHPDHDVQAGEEFVASVYNAVRSSPVWNNTALLIVYDEHGGIFDHVPPPSCTPDEFSDPTTGFKFDRLGVRVPAILVSPWVPEGAVISPLNADGTVDGPRVFEHASIPNTVTDFFIGDYDARTDREKKSETFLDLLSLPEPRTDAFTFNIGGSAAAAHARVLGAAAGAGAAPSANAISIPKATAAINPDRPLSGLLRDHVDQLHTAELSLPLDQQTDIDVQTIRTEGEASEYIRRVTAKLHYRGVAAPVH